MTTDRYKYFRIEARELLEGLSQGLIGIGQAEGTPEALDRLLRLAHTLKGAARVVGQAQIAGCAHDLEDLLVPYRQTGAPASRELVDDGLALLDRVAHDLAALTALDAAGPQLEESFETVRVDLSAMDALLAGLFEARTRMDGLKRQAGALQQVRHLAKALARELGAAPRLGEVAEELDAALAGVVMAIGTGLDQVDAELDAAHERGKNMRLMPVSTIFSHLERAARDAADSENKRVVFSTSGGDTRLDGHVLLRLRDALIQIVRNAIAHGIEPEAERQAAGKPPVGRVRLHVERMGPQVCFRCQDDGRGLSAGRLKEAAVASGLMTPGDAAALDDEAALDLVFLSGFTTVRAATQLAGRGIGLNAVREAIRALKGQIAIDSTCGRGASVTAVVPLSLASLPALLVEASGLTAAVPLDAVVGAVRVPGSEIARTGDRETVLYEGAALPFMPLSRAWGLPDPARRPVESVIAIRTERGLAAIGVDRLLGTRDVVVRPVPVIVGRMPLVTGVLLDAEGTPVPTLDPGELVAAAAGSSAPPIAAAPVRAPILVIDDSLTTRMLEKTILESAGYEVELATSAEEGLEKSHQRDYGLFIVDVEMPGMNGFEFVERARRDARLQGIPSVLVTSRGAEADRRRGVEAGARAYIVKSEFDQDAFLALVRGLVG